MPLLSETDPRKKRRIPTRVYLFLAVLAVILTPLAGLVAWGWERPVTLVWSRHQLHFGRVTGDDVPGMLGDRGGVVQVSTPEFSFITVKLPGGREAGWYVVSYVLL